MPSIDGSDPIAPVTVSSSPGDADIDTLIVPAYSSRPSAIGKLFLDFNGANSIDNWGGWWEFGGYTAGPTPPYNIDGDDSFYSDQELANIQKIWKGVAEKYSPFEIDVTTVQPSGIWIGGRVVIGGDGSWYGSGGGVALIGDWGLLGGTAFVWDSPSSTTYVAEAVAHEAGHMLGLYHQSLPPIATNEYADGFIMGDGDGGIGRWANTAVNGTVATSRDDDGVHNKGSQDDVAKIIGNGNFVNIRADDVGGSTGTATNLTLSNQLGVIQGATQGIITTPFDVDMFRINHGGGSLDVEVLAAEFRAMLNPEMTLHNSVGTQIAGSAVNNGSDGKGERIQFNNLDAGTYYIAVGGSGSYGDIGQFRLNVRAGLPTTAFNDTLGTATALGWFGGTLPSEVALGFHGTAVLSDSVTSSDNFDYFRLVAPANVRQLHARLSGLTTTASLAIYDDLDGNGLIGAGETIFASNPGTGIQEHTYNTPISGKTYYVRVARGSGAPSGNYQLRITTDTAPASLPPSVANVAFDPQPLSGARSTYDSIDSTFGDTTDFFRITAEQAGLFSVYLFTFAPHGDLRLDMGTDFNFNGVFDPGESLGSSNNGGDGSPEWLQEIFLQEGQSALIRVGTQVPGTSSNYSLQAIADYAMGGNTTGSLAGARDMTTRAAATVYEHLDGRVDFHDTYKIDPPAGTFQVNFHFPTPGGGHRVEMIRDVNSNNIADAGEIVASGVGDATGHGGFSHDVTAGANYYLRVSTQLNGEFPTIGDYRLTYASAGAVSGATLANPQNIAVTNTLNGLAGYLAFDPEEPAMTNLSDYYRFTLGSRTRFDTTITSINGPAFGVQVGQLDGEGNFHRIAGVGENSGVATNLSVNLDAGTYILRAYLPLAERQDTGAAGNYGLTFRTAAITDNSPPLVIDSAEQYEIAPVGVSFTFNQSVATSVDPSDVVIRNLDTNVVYPIGATFYDPVTRRAGYGVEGGVLPDGNYRATLLAGSVRDAANNPLAADYSIDFHMLAGDANRDRVVDITDLGILATNWQGAGKSFSTGDFNYDRVVDITDLGILATNWQDNVPMPSLASMLQRTAARTPLAQQRAIDEIEEL